MNVAMKRRHEKTKRSSKNIFEAFLNKFQIEKRIIITKSSERNGISFYKWQNRYCVKMEKFRNLKEAIIKKVYDVIIFGKVFRKYEKQFIGRASISSFVIISIIISFISPAITFLPEKAYAITASCQSDIDAVLMVDISKSMGDGGAPSKCEWGIYKNSTIYKNTKYNVTEEWCMGAPNAFDESIYWGSPFSKTFTPSVNSKIADAKSAVGSFLDNLKLSDQSGHQSGLVSFAADATLNKQISSDHGDTQSYVDNSVIDAGNGTNIGEAIEKATSELGSERGRNEAERTLILLTDGKANRPNGTTSSENADDVSLAASNAQIAADLGYKIYTIGLGNDINEGMLRNIASISGGNYYHAAASSELAGIYDTIYNEISIHACVPSSISGYKYDDKNNNGIDDGDDVLSGWEIILSGDKDETTTTDENGYYIFSGLMPGNYTVSEGDNSNKGVFIQTVPENNSYAITLSEGEDKTGNDFANYFPACGNSILDDFDSYTESCDDGILNGIYGYCNNKCSGQTPSLCGNGAKEGDEVCDGTDGIVEHQSCSGQCSIISLPYCGDGVKNGNEKCDGAEGIGANQSCTDNCTIVNLDFCGDNIKNGDEECDGIDWVSEHYSCTGACTLKYIPYCGDNIRNGNEDCDGTDGIVEHQSCSGQCSIISLPYCGDGVKNGNEKCDDGNTNSGDGCSSSCQIEQSKSPFCGNGLKESGEDCDGTDGTGEHQSCSNECAIINNPYCGDSVVNGNEACDDGNEINGDRCSSICEIEENNENGNGNESSNNDNNNSNNGGGSASIIQFNISDESLRSSNINENSVTISWLTSHFASSQVIYSKEGENNVLDLSDDKNTPPKYGYVHTTQEYDTNPKVTGHSVTITDLIPGATYYYRTVSRGSFAVSQEQSFTLLPSSNNINSSEDVSGKVKGVESVANNSDNCGYLSEYISLSRTNKPGEVEKLEKFLNDFENEKLAVNGVFEKADFNAVSRFQMKYAQNVLLPWQITKPTGNVFITTTNKINEIYCQKEIPLTEEQLAEIDRIILKFKN